MGAVTPLPQEQVGHFLRHSAWASLMTTDLNVAPGARGTARIAFVAPWTDLGRAAQALTVLDRELRRAATAWSSWSARTLDDAHDTLDLAEEGLTEERMCDALAEALAVHPEPRRSLGELRVIAADVDPFAVLVEPTGQLCAMLCALPASSLLYAMSGFGQDVRIRHYWHVTPSPRTTDDAFGLLYRLQDAREGWATPQHPEGASWTGPSIGRPSIFRAVAPAPQERGLPYAVVYAEDASTDATMAVIELLPTTTPTFDMVRARHQRLL